MDVQISYTITKKCSVTLHDVTETSIEMFQKTLSKIEPDTSSIDSIEIHTVVHIEDDPDDVIFTTNY